MQRPMLSWACYHRPSCQCLRPSPLLLRPRRQMLSSSLASMAMVSLPSPPCSLPQVFLVGGCYRASCDAPRVLPSSCSWLPDAQPWSVPAHDLILFCTKS